MPTRVEEKRRRRRRKPGQPKRLCIFRKSSHLRRWLLRNPWLRPLCVFNYAVVRIQSLIRRFIVRARIRRTGKPFAMKSVKKSKLKNVMNGQLDRYLSYLDKYRDRRQKPEWMSGGFSSWCAVRIQATYRMHIIRNRFRRRRHLVNQVAAIVIQTFWKNCRMQLFHQQQQEQPDPAALYSSASQQQLVRTYQVEELAVARIQKCWRSFCNRRIYRYFRDLIVERLSAASIELLRNIIPNEASAFDRAAGTHVRFRLGGVIFPPKIYYKIYTHRPLCDVNAFAPRDYTEERGELAMVTNTKTSSIPKSQYGTQKGLGQSKSKTMSKTQQQLDRIKVGTRYFDAVVTTTNPKGTEHWYKREEHNYWRPIAAQMFTPLQAPPWFQPTPVREKPKYFHYSSAYRKEQQQQEQRRTRRRWLRKFFKFQNQQISQSAQALQHANSSPALHASSVHKQGHMNAPPQTKQPKIRLPGYLRKHDSSDDHNAMLLMVAEGKFRDESSSFHSSYHSQLQDGNYNNSIYNPQRIESVDAKRDLGAENDDDDADQIVSRLSRSPSPPAYHHNHSYNGQPYGHGGKLETFADLLQWSAAVDFDIYRNAWAAVGCSKPSEYQPASMGSHHPLILGVNR